MDRAVGRPRERPLARPPRRLGVLVRLVEQQAGLAGSGGRRDPHPHPAVGLGDEREAIIDRREPRLADGEVVAPGHQAGTVVAIDGEST